MINNLPSQSLNLTATVLNGLNTGANQLNRISNDINQSSNPPINQSSKTNTGSLDELGSLSYLESPSRRSIEDSLIGTTKTKTQMQAMLKILEVENQLFDKSLGKIFNQKV